MVSLILWHLPVQVFSFVVEPVELLVEGPLLLELQRLLVQLQCCHSVLYGVVSDALNLFAEEKPRQEFERDHPAVRLMEDVHGVDHLLDGHDQIDHFEVVLQAVANEDAACVDKVAEFLVGGLQGG